MCLAFIPQGLLDITEPSSEILDLSESFFYMIMLMYFFYTFFFNVHLDAAISFYGKSN